MLYETHDFDMTLIWEHLFKNISEVQVIQNRLLKYLMLLDIRTRTDFLHTSLNTMKLEDIHKNNVLNFVNMGLMGKCPDIFNQYYQVKSTPYVRRLICF